MLASQVPVKFPIPFAGAAGGGYITPTPTLSQIGVTPGRASLTDGFVPLNMTPIPGGGVPPFGQDMNGILNMTTAAIQWLQAGGLPFYDSTFSTAIGGYPNGAMLRRADGAGFWISTADNNITNPDTGGAGWSTVLFSGGSSGIILGQGLCQLRYSSPTSLLLMPFNGSVVFINGAYVPLPAAGLPLASSLQTDNTDYNSYAYNYTTNISAVANNGGGLFRLTVGSTTNLATGYPLTVASTVGASGLNANWTITVVDATHVDLQGSTFAAGYTSGGTLAGPIVFGSTTAHVTGANGLEVMSGDVTKTMVGKFRLNGSGQFQQNASKWLVRSWFNDPGINTQVLVSGADVTVASSASYVEVSNTFRVSTMNFANEQMVAQGLAEYSTTGGSNLMSVGIGVNSTTVVSGRVSTNPTAGAPVVTYSPQYVFQAAEGTNVFSVLSSLVGGAGNTTLAGGSASSLSVTSR